MVRLSFFRILAPPSHAIRLMGDVLQNYSILESSRSTNGVTAVKINWLKYQHNQNPKPPKLRKFLMESKVEISIGMEWGINRLIVKKVRSIKY